MQKPLSYRIDPLTGSFLSLCVEGEEMLVEGDCPLFSIGLRSKNGNLRVINARDAGSVTPGENRIFFRDFPEKLEVTFSFLERVGEELELRLAVDNGTEDLVEWVEYPRFTFRKLAKNGGKGSILFPYNEGALVDDLDLRENSGFHHFEPEYPSRGIYSVFPNMLCSQFLCYISGGMGLYIVAEDPARGPKGIDFLPSESGNGVAFQMRIFTGIQFGESYKAAWPVVLKGFEGDWQEGATLYRDWFEANLPEGLNKVSCEKNLPDWYSTLPLVISYPVRGVHDADIMNPNALFPYENALPLVREFAGKTGSPILVLLMHWEGTAPWAPPYVWPPYGGEDTFCNFAKELHNEGNLLGVYCSGFGYTLKSNLVDDYSMQEVYDKQGLAAAMCRAPDNKTIESTICTTQRDGRDICVGTEKGRELLNEAYQPLFESPVDYAQILDQNHGGGQYFCHAHDHGHAPGPGPWMTETIGELLSGWKKSGGEKLFGCESAASEPFLPWLRFSDNRYELNWHIGEPVPLFAFLYHEYLHNFMGNQVSCGLDYKEDTMTFRMAYSFAAGDAMTVVLRPDGEVMSNWGCHDFNYPPNKEHIFTLAKNAAEFLKSDDAQIFMLGRMLRTPVYSCNQTSVTAADGRKISVPTIFASAWEYQGETISLFINHTSSSQSVDLKNGSFICPPFGVVVRK